MKKVKYYI